MKVIAVNFNMQMDNETFLYVIQFIDKKKQERIHRFHKWQDKYRTLIGELLTRMLIMETLKIKNSEIDFYISEFGKPELINYPNFHFNISHSGDWVVCAIHSSKIGVDVEAILNIDYTGFENIFLNDEYMKIINHSSPHDLFFEYWTLKESFVKCIGKGLNEPLNSFGLKFSETIPILIDSNEIPISGFFFKQYFLSDNYKTAVCSTGNEFPKNITYYTLENIVNYFRNL